MFSSSLADLFTEPKSKQTYWSVGKKTHTIHTIPRDYKIQEYNKRKKYQTQSYLQSKQKHTQ